MQISNNSDYAYTSKNLVVYPAPLGMRQSPDYRIEVNGHPVFMYHLPGMAGGTVSFASFDFSGKVTVSVTSLWDVDGVEVRPLSAGIPVTLEGNTATFEISKPQNLFIKWNGIFELPVYIFANPIEEPPEVTPDSKIRYFGPGVHHTGIIEVEEGETIYLEGGAFVYGTILAPKVNDVTIAGRGILCTTHIPFGGTKDSQSEMIGFDHCNNVSLSGIVLLDAYGWTVVAYNCDNVNINNIKIINEGKWSTDGINPCNCRDMVIEGCFIRCKDDCITIKGLNSDDRPKSNWAPIKNILVKNCTFWSDNNNAVVVGAETKAETIENIVFSNCDMLKVSNTCGGIAGVMSIISLDDSYISGILFEDIRIEYSTCPVFNFFYTYSIWSGQIVGSKKVNGGVLKDIKVKNITLIEGLFRKSYIRGLDDTRKIENVSFENLIIHGKHITDAEQGRFDINEFAENVRFK